MTPKSQSTFLVQKKTLPQQTFSTHNLLLIEDEKKRHDEDSSSLGRFSTPVLLSETSFPDRFVAVVATHE